MSAEGTRQNRCWVCGPDHPEGLRVTWEGVRPVNARLVVPARYQGFTGVAHGGTIAAILDDGMWHAVWHQFTLDAATVELTVRYRQPVLVGESVVIEAWAEAPVHHVVSARATLAEPGGRVLAEGRGRFMAGTSVHRMDPGGL